MPLSKFTGFDFVHITFLAKPQISDEEVIAIAKKQKRVIITHDLDYGEIYYLKEQGKIGVIQLRLSDQTSKSTQERLTHFFKSKKSKDISLNKSLVTISDKKVRVFPEKN
ncbi:hypothetical protein A2V80_01880 [Candidatus Woesebacteria bacterium RBG_16_39_8b]|uniref:DUF5615 domain-containing protein n=1 Tax=Candidatus Woesebacteria bacterium RBG_16_39_8b TaxID=1802482 RepID=A0A1F7XCB9_9BACT|nr:MAG: hypothetical protein A2V80_01880 [Candidatus Woesebacteria bacterium RBG_16_39_8b]